MDTKKLVELKRLLDEGIITQEEFDKEKEECLGKKKNKSKNTGLIVGLVVVFLLCISIIASNSGGNTTNNSENNSVGEVQNVKSDVPDEFSSEIPIDISGKMYDNIIGVPELKLTFFNKSAKDISAVKIYFSPKDVYGEDVNNIFVTNELYTDDTISAGSTVSKTWQMLDSTVKAGDVYIYSVYFSDGDEWGNREATQSDIKKFGYKLKVEY